MLRRYLQRSDTSNWLNSIYSWHQHRHPGVKKLSPRRVASSPAAHADLALICELDEQWSFVGSKARQHWRWYAYNTKEFNHNGYLTGLTWFRNDYRNKIISGADRVSIT